MKYLTQCCLVLLFVSILHAQHKIIPHAPFIMNIDYSIFKQTDSTDRLEVYFGTYPKLNTYELRDQKYFAFVKIRSIIREYTTQRLLLNDVSIMPIVLQDTSRKSFQSSCVSKMSYALSPGYYFLEVQAEDSLGIQRKDSMSFKVDVSRRGSKTYVSDVELCSNIMDAQSKDSPFYKNSYEVIPNPSLLYGTSAAPVVYCYTELYNLDISKIYNITTLIVDRSGIVMKSRVRQRYFKAQNIVDVTNINITSLISGKYRFQLVLSDTLGNEFARSDKQFFIYNPEIQSKVSAAYSAKTAEFAGLTYDELAEEFREAQYITFADERITFSKLSSIEARREFLAKFWSNIESGQHGQTNLTRGIYLDRVMTANQRYHSMGREGWETDRGRVYLLYAEPDEVQRFPSSNDSKPYEIWNYNQIESGVIFVFIDRSGFGDYKLVHSTKRGEIQDESWQRYLQ